MGLLTCEMFGAVFHKVEQIYTLIWTTNIKMCKSQGEKKELQMSLPYESLLGVLLQIFLFNIPEEVLDNADLWSRGATWT